MKWLETMQNHCRINTVHKCLEKGLEMGENVDIFFFAFPNIHLISPLKRRDVHSQKRIFHNTEVRQHYKMLSVILMLAWVSIAMHIKRSIFKTH